MDGWAEREDARARLVTRGKVARGPTCSTRSWLFCIGWLTVTSLAKLFESSLRACDPEVPDRIPVVAHSWRSRSIAIDASAESPSGIDGKPTVKPALLLWLSKLPSLEAAWLPLRVLKLASDGLEVGLSVFPIISLWHAGFASEG